MATPANRVLVVYVDSSAADAQANASALDEVTRRGFSGFLILPDATAESAQSSSLRALLGVDAEEPKADGKFPYPKMPTAVFSDSQASVEVVKALDISDVTFVAPNAPHDSVRSRLEQLLLSRDTKAKQLVLFHLTAYRPDHWIFSFVEKLLGTEQTASSDDCFVSIVRTAQRPHTIDPEIAAHPLRPRQSYERHHGKYRTLESPRRLFFSSFHCDRTRRDLASKFDEDEIAKLGVYGAMDARIFIKEMAFRLGFAPKYGA